MKNTALVLFLLTALSMVLPSCENRNEREVSVPSTVKDALVAKHPNAKDVKWEMEDGNYEADFKHGDQKQSAVISPAGKLISTETDIKPSELPAAVQATLEVKYHGSKVKEAEKIELDNETRYEAEVEHGGKKLEVILAADGTFLSEKDESSEDDSD